MHSRVFLVPFKKLACPYVTFYKVEGKHGHGYLVELTGASCIFFLPRDFKEVLSIFMYFIVGYNGIAQIFQMIG